jgi:hypothetical protein
MTRRERLERKLAKRREWADKRQDKAAALRNYNESLLYAHDIAFNTQPGHIPERARMIARTEKAIEHSNMAEYHDSKADGLERQLDRSIFSDDDNAVEAIEARIKKNEEKREQMKKVNAMYRKGDAAGLAAVGLNLEALREKLKTAYSWCQQPHPGYELQNLGGRITADRKRLEFVKRQQQERAQAQAAPNGVILKQYGEYCSVMFAEKPDRSILNALRSAGFHWGAGSWTGYLAKLPPEVKALLETEAK